MTDHKESDVLTASQRWLGMLAVPAMLFLLGYLLYHQLADTGFFTDRFGPFEMICLYGPIVLNMAPSIVRAVTGRRNLGRPFEASTALFLMGGSLWLFIMFPFDFSHLMDPFPQFIQKLFPWFTDTVGKVVLLFQVIIGLPSAIGTIRKFMSVRRETEYSNL